MLSLRVGMTTRSGSDKEEIENLYKSAFINQGIPGRAKGTTIHTTPTTSSKSTSKAINFSLNDSENSLENINETLVPVSDDSENDTVKLNKPKLCAKYKPPKKMRNSNPFAPLKAVPIFDGQNIPLSYFIEGCEEAKSMLPSEVEPQFARIIRTRIVGKSRRSIQDQNFDSVAGLTAFLKQVYGLSKIVY